MIQENWKEYLQYPANLRESYFSRRHGRLVLEVIGELQLENLRLLDASNKELISTKEFAEFLANDLSVRYSLPSISANTFLSFLAFNYLKEMNPFSNVLIDIVTLKAIQEFFSDERKASILIPKISQSKIRKNHFSHIYKQHRKEQQQEQQPPQPLGFFDYLGTPQTPQNFQNSFMLPPQVLEQQPKKPQELKQNAVIQLDDATEQQQIDYWMKNRNLKKERFQQLLQESEKIPDPISAIKIIKDKNPFITFQSSIHQTSGSLFSCIYTSSILGIPEVCSDPKPRKKQAETNAAAKFYPHLLYYIENKMPYFENDDEEFYYLNNKSATTTGGPSIKTENQDEEEEKISAEADFNLLAEFESLELKSESVSQVYFHIQRHEGNNGVDNIKTNFSEKQGIFSCVVQFFLKGYEVFSCQGRGRSKKIAKEVAFFKLLPLISNYYNPGQELPKQLPGQLKNNFQNLRDNFVECEAPEEY